MNPLHYLYLIAGCNGAGKTTASYTILPELLNCKEFVNVDEIAKGLSPFQPENMGMAAGRLMFRRVEDLLTRRKDFAIETTLAAKIHKNIILKAQKLDYTVTLVFFWLNNIDLAKQRVQMRVEEGGHHVPPEIIERRYKRGLENLFKIYLPICDKVMVFDNSTGTSEHIFNKRRGQDPIIFNLQNYQILRKLSYLKSVIIIIILLF